MCFLQQRILWAEAPSLRIRKERQSKRKEKHTDKREEGWGVGVGGRVLTEDRKKNNGGWRGKGKELIRDAE